MTDYLVMDIGGTNARIATSTPNGLEHVHFYKCGEFDGPGAVVKAYADDYKLDIPEQGVFAAAGAINDPATHYCTNGPWARKPVNFTNFGVQATLMNDFAAQAYATLVMEPDDYVEVVPGKHAFFPSTCLNAVHLQHVHEKFIERSDPKSRIVIMGPGTGLGVATASMVNGKFVVEDCEGSHAPVAAKTRYEAHIIEQIQAQGEKEVSYETVASGPGLVKVYSALDDRADDITPEQVVELARGSDRVARDTVEMFTAALARCAATAALMKKAQGGVIIAGGVIGKLGSAFNAAAFAREFRANDLPPESNFVNDIAVHAVTNPNSGLLGAHAYAQHALG